MRGRSPHEFRRQSQALTAQANNLDTAGEIVAHTAAIALNTAKVTYDDAAQVATNTADIATNVTAIALNTAKVTYDAQAAVAANTLKISYSTAASDAVALNTAKNSYPPADAVAVAALPAGLSGFEDRIAVLEAKMEFIPKAFGRFTTVASPALLGTSYNVTSVARGGTGQYAITIATDMTTANYTVMLAYEDATATIQTVSASSIATTGFNIAIRDDANALSDASESVSFAIYENNT